MIGCLPTQALAFSPVSIQTQRTQRKRLRLDGNRASHCKSTDMGLLWASASHTVPGYVPAYIGTLCT